MKELHISNEMLAAGIEAMRAAQTDCLTEADVVAEIYLAMAGVGAFLEAETLH